MFYRANESPRIRFSFLDSVLHIGFSTGTSDDVVHNLYSLIREDFADDFLPGLPDNNVVELENKLNRLTDQFTKMQTEVARLTRLVRRQGSDVNNVISRVNRTQ